MQKYITSSEVKLLLMFDPTNFDRLETQNKNKFWTFKLADC